MRCEQGDIAIILKAQNPANVSKIVKVVQYIGYLSQEEVFVYNDILCKAVITDHYWWVLAEGSPLETNAGTTSKAYMPDLWLQPIRPDLLDDDEDTVKEKDEELEKME